jgi:hypothetical protein
MSFKFYLKFVETRERVCCERVKIVGTTESFSQVFFSQKSLGKSVKTFSSARDKCDSRTQSNLIGSRILTKKARPDWLMGARGKSYQNW